MRIPFSASSESACWDCSDDTTVKQRLVAIVTVLLLGIITTLVVAWAPTLGVCRRQALIRTGTEWHSPQGAAIVTAELTHFRQCHVPR